MNAEAITERFAQGLLAGRLKELTPEQLAQVTEEGKANYLQSQREFAQKQIARFSDPESLYDLWSNGGLGTHNPNSRRLFSDLTGVDLGKTNTSAQEAIFRHIGPETIARIEQQQREEAEAKRAQSEAKKLEAKNKKLQDIRARFENDKEIMGEELLILARSVGIDVHPRTAGLLKEKVRWIKNGSAGIVGKNSGAAFEVYNKVALALHATA